MSTVPEIKHKSEVELGWKEKPQEPFLLDLGTERY